MDRNVYDPRRAAEFVRELAATTDAQLVEEIRAAADVVLRLAEVWRGGPGWPHGPMDRDAYATATVAAKSLAALPSGTPLSAVTVAVGPILNGWWPERPEAAAALHEAVERLRRVAMHKTTLVSDARWITSHGGG
ncbi:hypothetical protein [Phytohabitans houttuyneae]|uniref:hypothetical protein n=1 Tax=Phytohabitans houttuyneae TaxID=1076126 RepID=UPI00156696C2|nr:hypothetical protein [Phytohabitans houttuyneae]